MNKAEVLKNTSGGFPPQIFLLIVCTCFKYFSAPKVNLSA